MIKKIIEDQQTYLFSSYINDQVYMYIIKAGEGPLKCA